MPTRLGLTSLHHPARNTFSLFSTAGQFVHTSSYSFNSLFSLPRLQASFNARTSFFDVSSATTRHFFSPHISLYHPVSDSLSRLRPASNYKHHYPNPPSTPPQPQPPSRLPRRTLVSTPTQSTTCGWQRQHLAKRRLRTARHSRRARSPSP